MLGTAHAAQPHFAWLFISVFVFLVQPIGGSPVGLHSRASPTVPVRLSDSAALLALAMAALISILIMANSWLLYTMCQGFFHSEHSEHLCSLNIQTCSL